MWSYIQYRKIRNEVEEGNKKKTNPNREPVEHAAKDHSNAERGISKLSSPRNHSRESKERENPEKTEGGSPEREEQEDPFMVCSIGEDDPMDPRNWPLLNRCKNIAILAILIFTQAWAGAAPSMTNGSASQEFHISKTAENAATAMYLFGIGSGSLFVGPLSETIGRNPTYLIATFFYLCFVLGSALTPTFAGQVFCRYFVGLFASATLAINGSSVRDQFRPVKRAFVFPVIAWANVAAPVIAPIAGGWIVQHPELTWRWTDWTTLIISSFAFLLALLFLPETNLQIFLSWKAAHLRRVTGDTRYTSSLSSGPSFISRMRQIGLQPLTFLLTEPVITILGSYLVLLYTLLFTFLSGFDYIFTQTYHLSKAQTGSCFGAIALGATCFTLSAPLLFSWSRHKTEHVRRRPLLPEFRLWPAILTAPLLPVVLFWLGWTNYASIPIYCSLAACFIFGIILIAIYVSAYEYIIDSYGEQASMALASVTMARYVVAGGMVMAARPMFEGLGVHWTMTFLGILATVLAPAPAAFWWWGARLRRKSRFAEGDGDGDDGDQ